MNRNRIIGITAALAAIAVAVFVFFARGSSPKSAALTARQHSMEMLGASIAKLRPKGKVLVLSNPFTKNSGLLDKKAQFERAGVRGLRQGLGPDWPVIVVFPDIRPEFLVDPQSVFIPPDSRTPLSFLIRPGAVDELANAHPECSVIVSLIGLPEEADQAKVWTQDDPRSFALLLPDLRMLGSAERTVQAFERGKLLAVVAEDTFNPGHPLIVTSNNVSEVLERQPQALGF